MVHYKCEYGKKDAGDKHNGKSEQISETGPHTNIHQHAHTERA